MGKEVDRRHARRSLPPNTAFLHATAEGASWPVRGGNANAMIITAPAARPIAA
jgi:hypothetical protein